MPSQSRTILLTDELPLLGRDIEGCSLLASRLDDRQLRLIEADRASRHLERISRERPEVGSVALLAGPRVFGGLDEQVSEDVDFDLRRLAFVADDPDSREPPDLVTEASARLPILRFCPDEAAGEALSRGIAAVAEALLMLGDQKWPWFWRRVEDQGPLTWTYSEWLTSSVGAALDACRRSLEEFLRDQESTGSDPDALPPIPEPPPIPHARYARAENLPDFPIDLRLEERVWSEVVPEELAEEWARTLTDTLLNFPKGGLTEPPVERLHESYEQAAFEREKWIAAVGRGLRKGRWTGLEVTEEALNQMNTARERSDELGRVYPRAGKTVETLAPPLASHLEDVTERWSELREWSAGRLRRLAAGIGIGLLAGLIVVLWRLGGSSEALLVGALVGLVLGGGAAEVLHRVVRDRMADALKVTKDGLERIAKRSFQDEAEAILDRLLDRVKHQLAWRYRTSVIRMLMSTRNRVHAATDQVRGLFSRASDGPVVDPRRQHLKEDGARPSRDGPYPEGDEHWRNGLYADFEEDGYPERVRGDLESAWQTAVLQYRFRSSRGFGERSRQEIRKSLSERRSKDTTFLPLDYPDRAERVQQVVFAPGEVLRHLPNSVGAKQEHVAGDCLLGVTIYRLAQST